MSSEHAVVLSWPGGQSQTKALDGRRVWDGLQRHHDGRACKAGVVCTTLLYCTVCGLCLGLGVCVCVCIVCVYVVVCMYALAVPETYVGGGQPVPTTGHDDSTIP